jgi:Trypsin-like serine proteases, typically periplasmic, contain C-terminal PDZ domain
MLPEVNGALVMGIVPDSPAAKGGIRRGDVITQVNGQAITRADQLQTLVENSELGKPLQITVKRGDLTRTLSVRPAELQPAGRSALR